MPQDYKNRASTPRKKKSQQQIQHSVVWWKWLLIALLIALFVTFLVYLKDNNPSTELKTTNKTIITDPVKTKKTKKKPKHQDTPRVKPVYQFYTILPETEVSLPDIEINTRRREELLGKRKTGHYTVQAGSFRLFIEADKLKAKLALMGIESRIEKAIIKGATWNRVKMGPFNSASQISILKKRLKKNGVDNIVTEIKG